ncbi:AAA family ATPase [Helicobacter pylori]
MGNKNISSGISQIVLKNAATFDESGASFEDLNSINFIYGTNGSGKTTTSSFLKNLAENGDKNKFANSEIEWYGESLKIEVYNKQFKEEQFRNSQVKGIFTLGKKTNENLENIESKKESINKEKEKKTKNEKNLQKLKQEREEKEKDFTDSCWEKLYKKHKEDFKETLKGLKRKENFKKEILEEFKNNERNESKIVKLEELKENIRIVFSKNQTELVPLECNLTDFDSVENHSIWEQKIVGSGDVAIADLIKKLSNEDWVAQGREYLSKDSNACPFCQQETITEEFKKQLESYFDTSYQESTETIKEKMEDYASRTAEVLERLDEIVKTEQDNLQTKLNTEIFKRIIETLRSKINGNWQKMHDKSKEMSRSFKLESTKNEIKEIRDLIDTANQQIANHNEMIKDIQNQKKICVEQTWKFLVNEFKSDIQEYNKKHCGLEKGIKKLENEISEIEGKIKELENEIRELEKTMVSIKPIVNEINVLLKGYGFTNFSLACAEDEKTYRIQRENGQLVGETLSEGEVTFITFLYYYHLTKGSLKENDISKNKVLVIDDPISSLDSNILFIVSVLVKDLMKETTKEKTNIKQVIILTHNTYFYKEITLECDKRYQGKYSFWIIKKDNNVSKIEKFEENPIKNSYELLWQEVRWAKEKQAKENNISWVSLQNVMRRIIEYYFRILGGFKHNDSLSEYFENIEEKQVCNSFISWFNDGSHGISDDLLVQSQDTSIETYLKVFENIFKKTGHEAHYKMMMEPLDKNKE